MTMSVVTSVNTVGSKKLPPWAARLPAVTTLAPFLTGSAMCASTFSTAFMSISGPMTAPRSNPGGLGEAFDEGVIDAVLHQDAVGVDARPRRMTREKYSLTLVDCRVLAIDGWK